MQVTGNTSHTRPENRAFYPALDGLRTVAFLLVFCNHYLGLPWGWAGVNFFFVLSGFLITGILFDARDDLHRARNFYIRRALRIFPLYYLVLLGTLLVWPAFHWHWDWRVLAWVVYLGNFLHFSPEGVGSMAQRMRDFQLVGSLHGHALTIFLGHFWSLCIEEQFYLLWPWIVFWVRDRRILLWICGLALPVCLGLRLLAQHTFPAWMVSQNVLSRFTPLSCDGLLFGGFLALLLRGPYRAQVIRVATWLMPPFLTLCVAFAFRGPAQWHRGALYAYPDQVETLGFTVLDILGALLLLSALEPRNWLYKLLGLRPMRWAGRISYGAYVLHDIPHEVYSRFGPFFPSHRDAAAALIGLVCTYLLAALSFRFLETPFLNLKERLTLRA